MQATMQGGVPVELYADMRDSGELHRLVSAPELELQGVSNTLMSLYKCGRM